MLSKFFFLSVLFTIGVGDQFRFKNEDFKLVIDYNRYGLEFEGVKIDKEGPKLGKYFYRDGFLTKPFFDESSDSIVIDVYHQCRPFFKNYTLVLYGGKASVIEYRFKQAGEDLNSENFYLYKETWELEDKSVVDSVTAKINSTILDQGFKVKEQMNTSEGISDFPRFGLKVYQNGTLIEEIKIIIRTQNMKKAFSENFVQLWVELMGFDSTVKEKGEYLGSLKIN